ncbi:MAG: aminomethyl-transferring glycine dehydrogenase subunit GcvPB [Endomicrobiaceae bacterium]|jgi:glycine dehydrogenase subunit 2|nr:aminomethyl-transferring glycine dehydrogenase subunit GcvPB [Endomicrobiaceae bacterium]MDD3729959.1 aminomethyl-transferring glycine dehydrogenase subunit GcvPB [Endomicrobiaceae bacterium]MDD4166003.1 aminomethyl-transferring glycine dehydrogenase subunit GcvPB [Endomicrobiaceae bacterium]
MNKILNEINSDRETQIFDCDVENDIALDEKYKRKNNPNIPDLAEGTVVRHYTALSRKNYALSTTFYPLGSCTMKYNPIINEKIASCAKFAEVHPLQPENTVQGNLEIMFELEKALCEISGMNNFTLQPAAGAHGEHTGLLIISEYFKSKKEKRTKIIVPDSAHGTNPASANLSGFEVISLKSEPDGTLSPDKLKEILTPEIACIMMTNPNTLGVFEKHIPEIAEIMHANGSLLYYDGANLNAVMGIARPGDMGFDVMHINLHKTFSTPHGGGGPGSGPVGVKSFLKDFLPVPTVVNENGLFKLNYKNKKTSVGQMKAFYGNFPVLLKAFVYIKSVGGNGLKEASVQANINANYVLNLLKDKVTVPAGNVCTHEFVLSSKGRLGEGVRTLDVAKRLLDYGYYAPTIYFPLIVEEAMMIEPTETESKQTLDEFVKVLSGIIDESKNNPEAVKNAPSKTPVSRLNEVEAARNPKLRW